MSKKICALLVCIAVLMSTAVCSFADEPAAAFTDVPADAWYARDVEEILLQGIMEGDGGFFYPEKSLNRAMLVTILMRMDGTAEEPAESPDFSDVPADAWYAGAVAYAAANGIAEGYGDGTFRPLKAVSRQEFAVMLYNRQIGDGLEHCEPAESQGFADSASVSAWARDAMDWAVSSGVLRGSGDSLQPQRVLTRAEAAAALNRLLKLSLD